jgi:hypothetical protein
MKTTNSRTRSLPIMVLLMGFCCNVGCDKSPSYEFHGPLSRKLMASLNEASSDTSIDLVKLTDFEWDQMFYFPEGISKKSVNERLGIRFYKDTFLAKCDGGVLDVLIVFKKGQKVVHAFHGIPCTRGQTETDYLPSSTVVRVGKEKGFLTFLNVSAHLN